MHMTTFFPQAVVSKLKHTTTSSFILKFSIQSMSLDGVKAYINTCIAMVLLVHGITSKNKNLQNGHGKGRRSVFFTAPFHNLYLNWKRTRQAFLSIHREQTLTKRSKNKSRNARRKKKKEQLSAWSILPVKQGQRKDHTWCRQLPVTTQKSRPKS